MTRWTQADVDRIQTGISMPAAKLQKYRNQPQVVDGIRFASKAEARRYGDLCLLEKAGEIINLALQPRYDFVIAGVYVGHYTADFSYFTGRPDFQIFVVEDVKSKATMTEAYGLRRKLMHAIHGIRIMEVS